MNRHLLLLAAVSGLIAVSCAKSETTTTGQDARTYLNLWMADNHPGILPNADGIYILQETPGTGEAWDSEKYYVFINYTIRTLGGTISATTEENLARQLGTYAVSDYYGAKYQSIGSGLSYAGVDALLKGMRIGGSRTAVLPAWLLTTSRYDKAEDYITYCTNSTHLIYTLTLQGQTDNPETEQTAVLASYVKEHYGNVESTTYYTDGEADGTFYFISDISGFKEEDKIADYTTVKVNYTGRRLDGQVFDTTNEIIAKDAGIYTSGKEYTTQSVYLSSNYSEITLGGNSLIGGFAGGLSLMHWKGQKATVLFTSQHGYSSSGSGSTIPGYAPLVFELEITAD